MATSSYPSARDPQEAVGLWPTGECTAHINLTLVDPWAQCCHTFQLNIQLLLCFKIFYSDNQFKMFQHCVWFKY